MRHFLYRLWWHLRYAWVHGAYFIRKKALYEIQWRTRRFVRCTFIYPFNYLRWDVLHMYWTWGYYWNWEKYLCDYDYDGDALCGYDPLWKKFTGLDVDVFYDNNNECKGRKMPFCLFFLNQYGDDYHEREFLPLIVSQNPVVPLRKYTLKIDKEDFKNIRQFVIENKKMLIMASKEQVEREDFNIEIYINCEKTRSRPKKEHPVPPRKLLVGDEYAIRTHTKKFGITQVWSDEKKFNYINEKGELISPNQWFGDAYCFRKDGKVIRAFVCVGEFGNAEHYYLYPNGKLEPYK